MTWGGGLIVQGFRLVEPGLVYSLLAIILHPKTGYILLLFIGDDRIPIEGCTLLELWI